MSLIRNLHDLALLSHNHTQMQDKTTRLAETSAGTGLKINKRKTELMKINTTAHAPVTVGGEPIREDESFVYLGSVVDKQGGTDHDVSSRIGKARAAFIMLKNIWASMKIGMTAKLRLFHSNVKSMLLYGSETWRMTKPTMQNIQTSSTCVFNASLTSDGQRRLATKSCGSRRDRSQSTNRSHAGSGAGLGTPSGSQHPATHARLSNPQGHQKRGRPRNSWR